jgi:hypothetical protein
MRLEGLGELKNAVFSSGMEPAIFRYRVVVSKVIPVQAAEALRVARG